VTSPTSTMPASAVADSGDDLIDALLGGVKWGSAGAGVGATVGYSFPGASGTAVWAAPAAYGSPHNEPATASALSPANQAATRLAMQAWANLANLSLVEIGETATDVGDIRLAHTADPAIASYWGWSLYPNDYWPAGGDIWINVSQATTDWSPGTNDFSSLLHEIGHSLGLKHPFDDQPVLPPSLDNEQYTLMAYESHPHGLFRDVVDHGGGSYSWTYFTVTPQTPMLYDIAAIQYLYGANTSYHTGDDVYGFDPESPFFVTIWDAGGIDTLSVANFALRVYARPARRPLLAHRHRVGPTAGRRIGARGHLRRHRQPGNRFRRAHRERHRGFRWRRVDRQLCTERPRRRGRQRHPERQRRCRYP
jgi:serralysin